MRGDRFDERRRQRYLGALRQGLRRGAAARAAGVDRHTVYHHAKADPEFAAAAVEAEVEACDQVEDALWQAALDGNVGAMRFWLCNRSGARWQDRRTYQALPDQQQADPQACALAQILARLNASRPPGAGA